MSDTLADLASCLPSEIFTGDMDDNSPLLHTRRYDFASSSSTESESDDDDNASGLTRRFTRSVSLQERLKTPYHVEKKRVFSGSPESTLNWNASGPTQVRSSPATPFVQQDLDAWDLIYAAAGQIARMKMNHANAAANAGGLGNRRLPGAPLPPGPPLSYHNPHCAIRRSENEVLLRQQQFRHRVSTGANFYGGGRFVAGRPVGFSQPAWPPHPVETHRRQQPVGFSQSTGGCGNSTAVAKKECAGTGVFLPRNYCNIPPEPKKKPVYSPLNQPARIPITATTRGQQNMNGVIPPQFQLPTLPHNNQFKRDEVAEMIMAHRQKVLMLAQQRRNGSHVGMGQQEVVLPQEWTY